MSYKCEFFEVGDWQIADWTFTYAPLNIEGELAKMNEWLKANPRRRKKDYFRFVVNWLNRAHAQVLVAQTTARVQARAGAATERVGCWVDGDE